MSSYGLQVKSKVTRLQPEGNHRLQAWVSDYNDMEPEIFVYQRYPALPGETEPDDKFVNVASVADMAEYPTDEPVGDVPFFRLTSFDVIFRSVDVLDRTWNAVKGDIQYLLDNKNKLDELGDDETINYNYSAYESSSSSSNSSSSESSTSISSSSSSEAPYSTVSSSSST